jgi:hypothetical protein
VVMVVDCNVDFARLYMCLRNPNRGSQYQFHRVTINLFSVGVTIVYANMPRMPIMEPGSSLYSRLSSIQLHTKNVDGEYLGNWRLGRRSYTRCFELAAT